MTQTASSEIVTVERDFLKGLLHSVNMSVEQLTPEGLTPLAERVRDMLLPQFDRAVHHLDHICRELRQLLAEGTAEGRCEE